MRKTTAICLGLIITLGFLVALRSAMRSPVPSVSLSFVSYSAGERKASFNIANPTRDDILVQPFVYIQMKTSSGWTNAAQVAWWRENRDTMLLDPIHRHETKTIEFEVPASPGSWRAGILCEIAHRSALSWLKNEIQTSKRTNVWSGEVRP